MYNSIEYSDNYSKRLGSLRQYYRDEPATTIGNSESIKSKMKITGKLLPMVTQKMLKSNT